MSTTAARTGLNMQKNKDNTARVLTQDYQTPTYAASITLALKASTTKVKIALVGALTLNANVQTVVTAGNVPPPFVGDTLVLAFTVDASNRIVTFGTGFDSAGTLTLTASKKGSAMFMFDGGSWVEIARTITA
jgi:hypothetical protein